MEHRYLIQISLSVLLTFSFLAPSLIIFTNYDEDTIVVVDNLEDENDSEEEMRKFDEKEFIFENFTSNFKTVSTKQQILGSQFLPTYKVLAFEVVSPPPEFG